MPVEIDSGNTAWVLASSALVLLMTPGLAFFYGGMVRPKNILSVLMHNWLTMAIVSAVWVLVGFSLAFGDGGSLIGDFSLAGLSDSTQLKNALPGYEGDFAQSIPPLMFAGFQLMFAIITPALFTGTIAERMKLLPFALLILLWSVLVYAPIAHWVFSPLGWLFELGSLDFAGGTVVHINAGAAALALAMVVGKRRGWPRSEMPQNNLPFVLLGAGLLWFGWFGFNAGSALGGGELASWAFVNTNTAAGLAVVGWILTERLRGGKPTTLGAASGAVAGLVAITPAAGFVTPIASVVIGFVAGIVCCLACGLKYRAAFDDALDVVGVHLFGGLVGALAVGLFGTLSVNSLGADGLFYGGGFDLLGKQAVAVGAVFAYSFIVTWILAKLLQATIGLRVPEASEETGLDLSIHGEVAYDFGDSPLGGAATEDAVAANRIQTRREERTGHEDANT